MDGRQELIRRLVVVQAVGMIGWVALGLGLFGLSVEAPGSLHPLLESRGVNLALVGGGLIVGMIELRVLLPTLRALKRTPVDDAD